MKKVIKLISFSMSLSMFAVSAPASDASSCIKLENNGSSSNRDSMLLVNTCNFAVDVSYCYLYPKSGTFGEIFDCQNNKFGNTGIGPRGSSGINYHSGRTEWFACKSPSTVIVNSRNSASCSGGENDYSSSDDSQYSEQYSQQYSRPSYDNDESDYSDHSQPYIPNVGSQSDYSKQAAQANLINGIVGILGDHLQRESDLATQRGNQVYEDEELEQEPVVTYEPYDQGAGNVQGAQGPEAVFNNSCGVCHNGQVPIGPKKGDVAAWEPRLKQGMPTLVKHVTEGFSACPPRGLCMGCSAEDYEAVITWMSK